MGNYHDDVSYEVWRRNGNADRIDYDRVEDCRRDGYSAEAAAASEMRHWHRQEERKREEREQEEEEMRRSYEEQAAREAEEQHYRELEEAAEAECGNSEEQSEPPTT
jgi:hypothetical protein